MISPGAYGAYILQYTRLSVLQGRQVSVSVCLDVPNCGPVCAYVRVCVCVSVCVSTYHEELVIYCLSVCVQKVAELVRGVYVQQHEGAHHSPSHDTTKLLRRDQDAYSLSLHAQSSRSTQTTDIPVGRQILQSAQQQA